MLMPSGRRGGSTEPTLKALRRRALNASLFAPTSLAGAVATLGFVQADPIRSPARTQDLVLRHRVAGYRAGDLEQRFARLRLEEDFLYAYGFMPRATLRLLQPRHDPAGADGRHVPSGLAADVLAFVREHGATHPRDLATAFGRERAVNGWGGFSKATTRALQMLHYYGLLRVARRRDGIRIYEAAQLHADPLPADERMRSLARLVMRILCPISEPSLRATLSLLTRGAPDLKGMHKFVQTLVKAGEFERAEVDGEAYLWPAADGAPADLPREVRFLAPFDPVVWDRRRFEHVWGWRYRFEAYTPEALRQFGYYAMPLLWGDEVIGWVNVVARGERLDVEVGYAGSARPRAAKGRDFRQAFDAEVARMEAFLARQ
jgi:uncharacterized protein